MPEEAFDAIAVFLGEPDHAVEPASARGRLLLEEVLAHALEPSQLAASGGSEALGRGLGRLHLRHVKNSLWDRLRRSGVERLARTLSSTSRLRRRHLPKRPLRRARLR